MASFRTTTALQAQVHEILLPTKRSKQDYEDEGLRTFSRTVRPTASQHTFSLRPMAKPLPVLAEALNLLPPPPSRPIPSASCSIWMHHSRMFSLINTLKQLN
jgi:hypothetical protein